MRQKWRSDRNWGFRNKICRKTEKIGEYLIENEFREDLTVKVALALPDGTGQESVEVEGYCIHRDGRIMKKKQNTELVGDQISLYISGKRYQISKQDLVSRIFWRGEGLYFPDATGKDSVNWRGYTIYRNGRVEKDGKEVKSKRISYICNMEIRSIDRSRLIYAIFRGHGRIRKNTTVIHLDGDKENYKAENLAIIEPGVVIERRALTREQTKAVQEKWQEGKTYRELAEEFGVSQSTVRKAALGQYEE